MPPSWSLIRFGSHGTHAYRLSVDRHPLYNEPRIMDGRRGIHLGDWELKKKRLYNRVTGYVQTGNVDLTYYLFHWHRRNRKLTHQKRETGTSQTGDRDLTK